MVARRDDSGGGIGSCIGVHTETVIVVVTQVRMAMVVVVGMEGECKKTARQKRGHLQHVGHTAHVPLADVLVEGRRPVKHISVGRHDAEGGREGTHSVRSRYTAVEWGRGRERIAW